MNRKDKKQAPTQAVSLDPKQLKSITDRLDAMIRMVILSLPKDVSDDTKVSVLSQMGFQPNEIAPLRGSTPNAVRIRLYKLRKKAKEETRGNEQAGQGSEQSESDNEVALLLYMLSHYVADGHMPLHCDDRAFSDEIHGEMEELWEENMSKYYKREPRYGRMLDPRKKKLEYQFLLDEKGFPLLSSDEAAFRASLLGEVTDSLAADRRPFILGFGKDNANVWDYMVDVGYFSYLESKKLYPENVDGKALKVSEFRTKYLQEFRKLSIAILADAVESIARIWLQAWKEYYKL